MKLRTILSLVIIGLFALLVIYYFYPYSKIPDGVVINKIVVLKSKHKLLAYSDVQLVKTFLIAIGKVSNGDKRYEGDHKTPEGRYYIDTKNPNSSFHKNLGISYPNAQDISEAKKLGRPAGGDVKIHGLKNGQGFIGRFQRWMDWTNGCIALTNEELDDLYGHIPVGTIIFIKP